MKQASFLARRTWGQPNYLLLALATAFLVALAPIGVQRAVKNSANRPDEWLPASTAAVKDLQWFRDQVAGERLVLVSWDGCTLNDSEQLRRLAKQLTPENAATPEARQRARWFASAVAGPDMLDQLTAPPLSLPADQAIARLEGVLVGPRLPDQRGQAARATCLAVELSPDAMRDEPTLRASLGMIADVAATECGVDRAKIRMAGDPMADLAIDDAGRTTLFRLAPLAAVISFAVCLWRLGSGRLALLAVGVGATAATMSLAAVFYLGVLEVAAFGMKAPRFGIADALTMSLFAPAYVMAIAATLRLIRSYQRVAAEGPLEGAAERAFSAAWQPIVMTAVIAAAGVAALAMSDLAPLVKFSLSGSLAILIGAAMALLITPVALHRFPPALAESQSLRAMPPRAPSGFLGQLAAYASQNPSLAALACCALLVASAIGADRLRSAAHVPSMLDDEAALLQDYAWFEERIGGVAPAEIVIAIPVERERQEGEPAEADGQQYRLTPAEQAQLVAAIHERVAATPSVTGVISPATFATGGNAAINDDYRKAEIRPAADEKTGRDLWRLSARLPATSLDSEAAEYDRLSGDIRRAVEPVLIAQEQRDRIVQNLHQRGGQLANAKVCVLFRAPQAAVAPADGAQEQFLADLLETSGVAAGKVEFFNLVAHEQSGSDAAADARRAQSIAALAEFDALVLVSAGSDAAAAEMSKQGLNVVDVADVTSVEESAAAPPVESGGPRPVRYLLAGMAPVAHATEQTLAADLRQWAPIALAAMTVAAMVALRSGAAGLAVIIAMLLPMGLVLGVMGWLGVGVDMGVVTLATTALILGVDAALHYFAAYRRAAARGFERGVASLMASSESMPGAIDVALAGCLGFAVLAASGLASLELFGLAAIPLALAAIGTACLALPALAAGQLAWYFGAPALPRRDEESVVAPGHQEAVAAVAPPRPHVLPLPADMRQDTAEGPHSALHAKLQRLRRSAGE